MLAPTTTSAAPAIGGKSRFEIGQVVLGRAGRMRAVQQQSPDLLPLRHAGCYQQLWRDDDTLFFEARRRRWHRTGARATDFGVVRFFSILARSWLSVQMAILLVATTQFPDLIHAFEHLKTPRTLTTIIAFLYRYLFVLTDEAYRLLRARSARSAGLPGKHRGGSLFWRAKVTGSMAGQLFLRSYERSDRIYNAMLARGYSGHIRTLNPHTMQRSDWLMLILSVLLLLFIQIIGWYR